MALTLLICLLASPSPVASQGVAPTATPTPEEVAPPSPTPTPAQPSDTSGGDESGEQVKGLFFDIEDEPPPGPEVETLASRFAGIDFGQLDPSPGSVSSPLGVDDFRRLAPRTVTLNLFEDASFTGRIEHVEPTASGYAFWGGLDGVELGTMTMVVNGDIVVGAVRTPQAIYTITTTDSGSYVIRQIDESNLPPLAHPLEVPSETGEESQQSLDVSTPVDDGSLIDVMVLYTPAAKTRMGGRAGIEALIDLYVAQTNQAYANSGAFQRIRLVSREETDYVESGEAPKDIERLQDDSDGYMDHVHTLRDRYAADLVHLIFDLTEGYTFAGIADFEGPFGTSMAAPSAGLIFAHELGHNMGLSHDRYQIATETEEQIEGWHYGYVNQRAFEPLAPESARWITIMSYERQCTDILGEEAWCPVVAYFSNPRLTYNGDPMGVSANNPSTGVDGPADAVRTLNERRGITANFRRSASSTPRLGLALSSYWLSENGGTGVVTATLHRSSSEDTKVTISASPDDAATLSKNRTLTIPAGRTRSIGAVTVTAVDNDDRTGNVEVTLSATATNPSAEGVVAPQSVKLYVIDDEADTAPTFEIGNVTYNFIAGEEDSRTLPEATGGNGSLTYSLSPEPVNGVTFVSGPPARIEVSTAIVAADETNYVLTATDSDGDTDSLAVGLTVENPGCAGSDAVSGYDGEGIVADCEALLASRDILRGERTLNWNRDLPIDEWEGVVIGADRVWGIDLGETGLSGRLPAELGSLSELGYLWLYDNELSGPIPPELGNIASLQSLSIEGNKLSGPVPPELGKLVNLSYLSLGLNQLSGPIPPELGSLKSLETLWLPHGQLAGSIPPELGELSNLKNLVLAFNHLSSTIPSELGSISNIENLDLAGNRLSGPIPPELGNLRTLNNLLLDHNRLSGEIPNAIASLTNLEMLHLRGNQFIGCAPNALFDVPDNDLKESGIRSCDERMTGLTISPGALVPPFDPDHTSYTAVVGTTQFTIMPTYGTNATLQILDQDGNAIAGADSSVAGHQIDLEAGVTVISLQLSTRDGNETAGHYTIWVNRASAPGAPDIETITPGGQSLTVSWNAPAETGGADIASYDFRYIESEATDKSDGRWTVISDAWTGGARRYTIAGLEAGVSYDVQVRGSHGAGAGSWSETVVGTPRELAETCVETLTDQMTTHGTWESDCKSTVRVGSYARFYAFTLDEPGDVAITLESEVDTYLYIREGEGTDGHIVHEDDDDDHSDFILASSTDSGISESLESGTYTIEATTHDAAQSANFTLKVTIEGAPGADCTDYSESPELAEKVESGELSPVCDRLPTEPAVIENLGDTGEYGGILRRFYLGPADGCNFFRLSRASLVRYSQDGFSLLPSVARDWEMSEDGKEWTFHLREGMKWSDGDDFTADDFVWQYENVILNEDLTPTRPAFLSIGAETGSIEKVDDTTVKFVFPQPNFLFAEMVAEADEICYGPSRNVPWAPAHYMQQFHIDFNADANTNAVDAGFDDWIEYYNDRTQYNLNVGKPSIAPWKFTNPLGEQVVLSERNPYFWAVDPAGNQLPYLDGIQLTLVENTEVGTLMAAQGEIDMQGRHIQLDRYIPLRESRADGGYSMLTWPTFGGTDVAFFFNMSLPGATGDAIRTKEFRQALSLAIDREVIKETMFLGFGELRQNVPPSGHPHYPGDDIAKLRTEYDVEEANRLLDSVFPDKDSDGFRLSSGERIVMSVTVTDAFSTWPDTAQVVGRAWEAVGVKTDVNQASRAEHFDRWYANEWTVMVWNDNTTASTFSRIHTRAPAGVDSFHAPGCGLWLQTGGREDDPDAEGYPCAQESLDLLDMHRRGPGLPEAERNTLGQEIYRTVVQNQYTIGTVGLSPMVQGVVVRKNTLRNVPDTAANDWRFRTPNSAFPEQWYFGPEIKPVMALPAALSAGPSHACALDLNGVISCQGVDDSAQVTGLPASGVFTAISVGERHSCAIDLGGKVQCWGSDEHGQVSGRPTSGEFIAIGAGARHTCAIDVSGSVHCWGSDDHGQSSPPTEGRFVAVGAGDSYTCGLLSDGTLECWGAFDSESP